MSFAKISEGLIIACHIKYKIVEARLYFQLDGENPASI